MKTRNLVLLIMVAALLVGWAAWTLRPPKKPEINLLGTKVLPDLPINRVHKIVLTTTNATFTLAKVKDIWTVADRFNFPAAFDKIAESLLQLSELKVGQVVSTNGKGKSAFNLLDPTAADSIKELCGTRVELRDENDGLLAWLLIGKPFMRAAPSGGPSAPWTFGDYADGQYVLTGNDRVILVSQTFASLTPDAKNWLESDFINEGAAELHEISVSGPEREPFKLLRPKEDASFTLEGLQAKEGVLDSAKVDQLSGSLNFLRFDDIADPALPPKETGLGNPVLFEARTRSGRVYTIRVGNTLTNGTADRYVQVALIYQAPVESNLSPSSALAKGEAQEAAAAADKTKEQKAEEAAKQVDESAKESDKAKALNERLAPWTFILKSHRVEPFLIKRAELIKKPEAPKESAPGAPTNEISAAATP